MIINGLDWWKGKLPLISGGDDKREWGGGSVKLYFMCAARTDWRRKL